MSPSSAHHTPDLAVVGAGVVGLTIAWRAALTGRRVVLVDRGAPGAATSHVAAGMLAPVSEADRGEPALLALGLRAAAGWPAFAAEVAAAGGIDPCFRPGGTLILARDRDEAEAVERERALREDLGLAVVRLRASQARALEPALAPTLRLALHAPDDHSVDPRRLVAALVAAATQAGVTVRAQTEVVSVAPDALTLTDGERVGAGAVVVAAGPWSAALGASAVRPVKGQLLRLRDPAGPGLVERVLRFEGGYLVPRADGGYVLGATVEERGFDTTVTAGGVFALLRDAGELVPGTAEFVIEELLAGLRPGTPDNTPIVGRDEAGVVWATGHHRNGILLAPVTADLVLAALDGDEGEPALSPRRFAGVPA